MALYPGATKHLIPKWNKVPITRYRRMNLHVAVWGRDSIRSLFAGSNTACSHFYINKAGGVEQLIDTKYRSAADRDGNDSTISVETEGGLSNVNGEKWTPQQIVALAKLWAWVRDTHDIKNQIAINTNTNSNSEGLSWHRLGIKGNFDSRPGLASKSYGGILYSGAAGKECPGDAKINQIPEIFAIANGDKKAPAVKPAGSVKPKSPAKSGSKVPKKQLNTSKPNGSTQFPSDYENLIEDGRFLEVSVGAWQILANAVGYDNNQRWDGDLGKLSWKDIQEWLAHNDYYFREVDGDPGYYTIVALQNLLADRDCLDTEKWLIDGKFQRETKRAFQKYLNTQNGS